MGFWVENGTKELEGWEYRLTGFLTERLSPEQITHYLDEFQRDIHGFYERAERGELPVCVHNAIPALSQIRSLLGELKQTPPEIVPIEIAARFAVLSFQAGLFLGATMPAYGVEMQKWARERAEMDHQEELSNAQKRTRKESSEKAAGSRRSVVFKRAVKKAGKVQWENGFPRHHVDLADYLLNEHVDEKGERLLALAGGKKKEARKWAIDALKKLAYEMDREELVYNKAKCKKNGA